MGHTGADNWNDALPSREQATAYTETLLACMQQRLEILRGLHRLADSQAQLADQADGETLFGLLARKQALVEELGEVQQRLQPYLQDDPEARVWRSSEHRLLCRQVAEEGKQLLQQTMHLEKHTLDAMSFRRDAVAAQLQDGRDSILAGSAYTADSLLQDSALDIGDL